MNTSLRKKNYDCVRTILVDRLFTPTQINKIIPVLDLEYTKEPHLLGEVIDCWNNLMGNAIYKGHPSIKSTPHVAVPSSQSLVSKYKVDMNVILADVEPRLLRLHPDKLIRRHVNIQNLGFIQNMNEHWTVLYNAPGGFYLQSWAELTKKIMYLDHKVLDLLYAKKELKEMKCHPLIKCAAVSDLGFDHIRTRYLFASRVGFKDLSQLYKVTSVKTKPSLRHLLLSDNSTFLKTFAPHCSEEEYECFHRLIKNHKFDEDDADIFDELAELESIKYEAWPGKLTESKLNDELKRRSTLDE